MSRILICGGNGFIGSHLAKRMKDSGHWVRSVDIVKPQYDFASPDEMILGDLRDPVLCNEICKDIDVVYQLAADMGGAGYIFTGDNDAAIMHNSVLCNVNVLEASRVNNIKDVFYSSSACIYPYFNQEKAESPNCEESTAYPAFPDSEYGWEKLFSERLYASYNRNYGMNCKVARFHNIFGPQGTWQGGKEKVPAALCRKVAMADSGDAIEIWGTGLQTRSFLYIDDCLDAVLELMKSDFSGPVNIGSEEMVSINELAQKIIKISGKDITLKHIDGPIGVNGRNSHNDLIRKELGWDPNFSLQDGLAKTYVWINEQVAALKSVAQ